MIFALKRFLLRWYQASDQPLPAWLERACVCDPRLRADRDAEAGLTQRLRTEPRPPSIEASPYLAARVNYGVKTSKARRAIFDVSKGFRMAALAGVVCVAFLLLSRWPVSEAPTETGLGMAKTTPDSASLAPLNSVVPAVISGESSGGSAKASLWENPLDQEVNLVLADAKGAVRFLATRFLPKAASTENKSG